MKKFVFYLGALLLACCLSVSCSSEEDEPVSIVLDKGTQTEQIVYADNTSKADGIKFTASGQWNAVVKQVSGKARDGEVDWLKLSAYEGGAGEHTLSLTLMPNLTGEDRVAEIVITCGDTVIRIRVEQKGTKQDGQKPQGAGRIFVEQAIGQYKGNVYVDQYIIEFTYYPDGRLHTVLSIDDSNMNGVIDDFERKGNSGEYYELTYDDTNKTVSMLEKDSGKDDNCEIHKGVFNLNAEGYISDGRIDSYDTNGSSNVAYYTTIKIDYKDGYAVGGEFFESEFDSSDVVTGLWENGNLTQIQDGYFLGTYTYSDILNNPNVSIDLNYLISQTEAYSISLTNGNAILNVADLIGKRSRNMLVSQIEESAGSHDNFSFTYDIDQDGLIRKASTFSGESEITMTFKYRK